MDETNSSKSDPNDQNNKSGSEISVQYKESYLNTIIFKDNKQIKIDAPFPTYLDYSDLINIFPKSKEELLVDFLIKDDKGILSRNTEITSRQAGVFQDVFKQLAKNITSGLGFVSLSLPIRVFEPRSTLERLSDFWSFAPNLLQKASESADFIERFKLSIVFALSGFLFSINQLKPFNPYLGETYQGQFQDGTNIYLEHVSHIPCISSYLILDKNNKYSLSGSLELGIEGILKLITSNSMTLVQKGKNTIHFKNSGHTITFQYPKSVISGIISGNRSLYWDGQMKFVDEEHNLKAIIFFNKSHPNIKKGNIHEIYGKIFYHDFKKNPQKNVFYEDSISKDQLPKEKNHVMAEITGSWVGDIYFNNKHSWNFSNNCPSQIYPIQNPLSSDPRFREDLVWLKKSFLVSNKELKNKYEEFAQKWKLLLEYQQRYERKLREEEKKLREEPSKSEKKK